jgi:hypothetical protein
VRGLRNELEIGRASTRLKPNVLYLVPHILYSLQLLDDSDELIELRIFIPFSNPTLFKQSNLLLVQIYYEE